MKPCGRQNKPVILWQAVPNGAAFLIHNFTVSVPGLTFPGTKGISNGAVCDLNDGGAADAITEGQERKVKAWGNCR